MTSPDRVYGELSRLLDCVCEALADSLGGPTCRCSLWPSFLATADFCGSDGCGDSPCDGGGHGQATVNVRRMYAMSERFPFPESEPPPCGNGRVGAEVGITVWRCAPGPDERGNPPTADNLNAAMAVILDDAARVREAILCCFRGDGCTPRVHWQEWRVEQAQGLCMGGTTIFTTEVYGGQQ